MFRPAAGIRLLSQGSGAGGEGSLKTRVSAHLAQLRHPCTERPGGAGIAR